MQGEGAHVGRELPLSNSVLGAWGGLRGAEVPYCDLPRRRPAPEDSLSTPDLQLPVCGGSGRGPEPERWVGPWGLRRGSRGRMPSPSHPAPLHDGSLCL